MEKVHTRTLGHIFRVKFANISERLELIEIVSFCENIHFWILYLCFSSSTLATATTTHYCIPPQTNNIKRAS